MLGFGLWEYPWLTVAIEGLLTIVAIYVYFRHSKNKSLGVPSVSRVATYSTIALAVVLVSLLVIDFLAISLELLSVLIILTIVIRGLFDSRLDKAIKGIAKRIDRSLKIQ